MQVTSRYTYSTGQLNIFRFGAAEYLKSKTVGETGVLSTQQKVICGFGAGIAEAVFAVTPFETIKVKYIQAQGSEEQSKPCGIIQETKNILKKEGAHGIYQGVTATVLKLGVDQMIKFVIMDLLKDFYKSQNDTKEVPLPILAMTGVTAASVAVFMSTPLDVVKTRMQSFQGRDFKNFVHCVKTIWKEEKLMGFVVKSQKTFCIYNNLAGSTKAHSHVCREGASISR